MEINLFDQREKPVKQERGILFPAFFLRLELNGKSGNAVVFQSFTTSIVGVHKGDTGVSRQRLITYRVSMVLGSDINPAIC